MERKGIDSKHISQLLDQNLSNADISKILNIDTSNVTYWRTKLQKNKSPKKKYNWDEVQKVYDTGIGIRKLLSHFDMNNNTLYNAIKRGDFRPRNKPTLAERKKRKRAIDRECWMRYYSKKKYQTPADEDLAAIKLFYANCPPGYEVDHIIPISKGGLHSITNLQYLTVAENRRKSNKLV